MRKGQEVQIPEPENMEKIGKDTTKNPKKKKKTNIPKQQKQEEKQ